MRDTRRRRHRAEAECRHRADRVPREADVAPGMIDGLLGRPRKLGTATPIYAQGYRFGASTRRRIWSKHDAGRRVA